MAGSLIVPSHARARSTGFSEAEIFNLMSGLERMTDEQVAQVLSVALGEVHDRVGPEKCVRTVGLLLAELQKGRAA